MSIRFLPGSARLTVLGSGWSNSSVESGDGLTEDGKLWEDIAGDFGYDFGEDVDWDNLSTETDIPVETDENGNKLVYEPDLKAFFEKMREIAQKDSDLMQYSIGPSALKNLWGGPVSEEKNPTETGTDRPHKYSPPVFFIQKGYSQAYLFQSEKFTHTDADGGNLTVNEKHITIRSGSSQAVYWSSCTTHFWDNYLPDAYQSYPIEYICWQCLHGSFSKVLVSATNKTATWEQIEKGEVYEKTQIGGKTYYIIKEATV